jgi:hypothetical protein
MLQSCHIISVGLFQKIGSYIYNFLISHFYFEEAFY